MVQVFNKSERCVLLHLRVSVQTRRIVLPKAFKARSRALRRISLAP